MDAIPIDSLPLHPLLTLALVVALYFLPLTIAAWRNMRHALAISVLTIVAGGIFAASLLPFLGGALAHEAPDSIMGISLAGWVAALVWSCMDGPKEGGR